MEGLISDMMEDFKVKHHVEIVIIKLVRVKKNVFADCQRRAEGDEMRLKLMEADLSHFLQIWDMYEIAPWIHLEYNLDLKTFHKINSYTREYTAVCTLFERLFVHE